MIHIYRVTRYPDHDNIIFQADDDTAQKLKRQFPVRIQETKLGFEPGYYTWLRDDYRDRFIDRIQAFFRYHFSVNFLSGTTQRFPILKKSIRSKYL